MVSQMHMHLLPAPSCNNLSVRLYHLEVYPIPFRRLYHGYQFINKRFLRSCINFHRIVIGAIYLGQFRFDFTHQSSYGTTTLTTSAIVNDFMSK